LVRCFIRPNSPSAEISVFAMWKIIQIVFGHKGTEKK